MTTTETNSRPLGWVKTEINVELNETRNALTTFHETHNMALLQNSRPRLHRAYGALVMLNLEGAAVMCDSLDNLLRAFEKQQILEDEQVERALTLAGRALAELNTYLDDVTAGQLNQPLRFFPTYYELNAIFNKNPVRESDLFFPDLEIIPPERKQMGQELTPTQLRRVRTRFQQALVNWIRQGDEENRLNMAKSVALVEAAQNTQRSRAFWWVAQAFIETLSEESVAKDNFARRLCSRVDAQILAPLDWKNFSSTRLMSDMLYVIAQVKNPKKSIIKEVQDTYFLSALFPTGEQTTTYDMAAENSLHELNKTVDLLEDVWNKYCAGNRDLASTFAQESKKLVQHSEAVKQSDLKRLSKAVSATAKWLQSSKQNFSDAVGMEVATAILLFHNALQNFRYLGVDFTKQVNLMVGRLQGCVSGKPPQEDENLPVLDDMTRQAQEKMLLAQLGQEIQSNMAQIEQILDSFFRDPSNRDDLTKLAPLFHQINGVFALLGQPEALGAINDCALFCEKFEESGYAVNPQDFEHVADEFSMIGQYIDTISSGAESYEAYREYVQTQFLSPSVQIAAQTLELKPAIMDAESKAEAAKQAAEAQAAQQAAAASAGGGGGGAGAAAGDSAGTSGGGESAGAGAGGTIIAGPGSIVAGPEAFTGQAATGTAAAASAGATPTIIAGGAAAPASFAASEDQAIPGAPMASAMAAPAGLASSGVVTPAAGDAIPEIPQGTAPIMMMAPSGFAAPAEGTPAPAETPASSSDAPTPPEAATEPSDSPSSTATPSSKSDKAPSESKTTSEGGGTTTIETANIRSKGDIHTSDTSISTSSNITEEVTEELTEASEFEDFIFGDGDAANAATEEVASEAASTSAAPAAPAAPAAASSATPPAAPQAPAASSRPAEPAAAPAMAAHSAETPATSAPVAPAEFSPTSSSFAAPAFSPMASLITAPIELTPDMSSVTAPMEFSPTASSFAAPAFAPSATAQMSAQPTMPPEASEPTTSSFAPPPIASSAAPSVTAPVAPATPAAPAEFAAQAAPAFAPSAAIAAPQMAPSAAPSVAPSAAPATTPFAAPAPSTPSMATTTIIQQMAPVAPQPLNEPRELASDIQAPFAESVVSEPSASVADPMQSGDIPGATAKHLPSTESTAATADDIAASTPNEAFSTEPSSAEEATLSSALSSAQSIPGAPLTEAETISRQAETLAPKAASTAIAYKETIETEEPLETSDFILPDSPEDSAAEAIPGAPLSESTLAVSRTPAATTSPKKKKAAATTYEETIETEELLETNEFEDFLFGDDATGTSASEVSAGKETASSAAVHGGKSAGFSTDSAFAESSDLPELSFDSIKTGIIGTSGIAEAEDLRQSPAHEVTSTLESGDIAGFSTDKTFSESSLLGKSASSAAEASTESVLSQSDDLPTLSLGSAEGSLKSAASDDIADIPSTSASASAEIAGAAAAISGITGFSTDGTFSEELGDTPELSLEGESATGTTSSGGIAGFSTGGTFSESSELSLEGESTGNLAAAGSATAGAASAGGIAGFSTGGTFSESGDSPELSLEGESAGAASVGGVSGFSTDNTFSESGDSPELSLEGESAGAASVGGVSGFSTDGTFSEELGDTPELSLEGESAAAGAASSGGITGFSTDGTFSESSELSLEGESTGNLAAVGSATAGATSGGITGFSTDGTFSEELEDTPELSLEGESAAADAATSAGITGFSTDNTFSESADSPELSLEAETAETATAVAAEGASVGGITGFSTDGTFSEELGDTPELSLEGETTAAAASAGGIAGFSTDGNFNESSELSLEDATTETAGLATSAESESIATLSESAPDAILGFSTDSAFSESSISGEAAEVAKTATADLAEKSDDADIAASAKTSEVAGKGGVVSSPALAAEAGVSGIPGAAFTDDDEDLPLLDNVIEEPFATSTISTEASATSPSGIDFEKNSASTVENEGFVEVSSSQTPATTEAVEIDEELVGIFIEEAREVLDNFKTEYRNLKKNPNNVEALTTIRRCTHTLKGSGRMVGLTDLGNLAWALEQTYNLWLKQNRPATPELLDMVRQEQEIFETWVEALKNHQPPPEASALIALAEELRGESVLPQEEEKLTKKQRAKERSAKRKSAKEALATFDDLAAEAPKIEDLPESDDAAALPAPVESEEPVAAEPAEPLEEIPSDLDFDFATQTMVIPPDEAQTFMAPDDLLSLEETQPKSEEAEQTSDSEALTAEFDANAAAAELLSRVASTETAEIVEAAANAEVSETAAEAEATTDTTTDAISAENASSTPPEETKAEPESEMSETAAAKEEKPAKGKRGKKRKKSKKEIQAEAKASLEAKKAKAAEIAAESTSDSESADNLAASESASAEIAEMPADNLESTESAVAAESAESAVVEESTESAVTAESAESAVAAESAEPAVAAESAESAVVEESTESAVTAESAEPAVAADQETSLESISADLSSLADVAGIEISAGVAQAEDGSISAGVATEEFVAIGTDSKDQASDAVLATSSAEAPVLEGDVIEAQEAPHADFEPISPELLEIFKEEIGEHLADLDAHLTEIENNPFLPSDFEITRAAHTVAGAAGTIGIMPIRHMGLALEHALLRRNATANPANSADIGVLREGFDGLQRLFNELIEHQEVPAEPQELLERLKATFPADELAPDAGLETKSSAEESTAGIDPEIAADAPEKVAADISAVQSAPKASLLPDIKDEIDQELLPIFLEDSSEVLEKISEEIRAWRDAPHDEKHPATLARHLHTFKGNARMVGIMRIGEFTHMLESQVEECRKTGKVEPAFLNELAESVDILYAAVECLEEGRPLDSLLTPTTTDFGKNIPSTVEKAKEKPTAPATKAPASSTPAAARATGAASSFDHELAQQTIRVRADTVDRLVNEAGEIAIVRSRVEGEIRAIRSSVTDLTESLIRLRRQARNIEIEAERQIQAVHVSQQAEVKQDFDPLELDRYTQFQELTRFLAESVSDVATIHQNLLKSIDDATAALAEQSRMNRSLQQDLMNVRMMPFSTQAERLHRLVRQTCRALNKQASLDITGGEIELDRSVLDKMMAPLEHLIRNALSHGIESAVERRQLGKPDIGEIRISLTQESNEIILSLSDDGKGMDPAQIRAKAIEKGFLDPKAEVDERHIFEFIFQPGFSTSKEVTQTSGRGVGMDVVKTEIGSLGGRVETSSAISMGTTFRLYLPLTLAVTQTLMVHAAGKMYAIPSSMVTQVLELNTDQIAQATSQKFWEWKGESYEFHFLPRLLGDISATPEPHRMNWVLLLRSGQRRIAVQVDDLQGTQEAVVKNIGTQVARVVGIAGATVLGDGRIVLILNPIALANRPSAPVIRLEEVIPELAAVTTAYEPDHPVEDTTKCIMVVDDSLTVRKITSRMLERNGYEVILAKDGLEALEKLNSADRLPDVVLSDIEMPKMDGFDLLKNIRDTERLKHLPVIMITSRTADKHRNFALKTGANEYLGKPYNEEHLLELLKTYTLKS